MYLTLYRTRLQPAFTHLPSTSATLTASLCFHVCQHSKTTNTAPDMTLQSPTSLKCANTQSAKLPSMESSASAESDTTQDDDTLTTHSATSQPTEDALQAVIHTVSNTIATQQV